MSQWPRPCPIPGHPHDDGEPVVVPESAWARLKRWHLHAPAERLPLPAVLVTWPAAWIMHWAQVPVHAVAGAVGAVTVLTWLVWARRHRRRSASPGQDSQQAQARDLFWPTEAALVAAAWGGWVVAAVAFGPTARPARWPTALYLVGVIGGYWWLRHHDAVQAARKRRDEAAAELADKKRWHEILPRIGLSGWHVQWRRDTLIGEERLITTSPENALATRIAGASSGIAEKLAHILGLPYGRIDVVTTEFPGQLIISIRTVDLSVRDAAYHPMTDPWPDTDVSPFAAWFPPVASIRTPITWGFCPEDGSPLTLTLVSEIGGRAVGVIGMTGSGKSNVLNDVREGITRCPDARMVQFNGAHMGDETVWEPLSALTICGPVATDETVRNKIGEALDSLCLLVTQRTATLAETGHSTFQPTEEDPAVCIIIDEVDEVVKHVPGAGRALEFLAGKQRKAAVGLVLATQRAVISALGGGGVRANMSEVLVGKVARASESRHATGAETEIPDIREYSKGAPGYFQRWDPHSGTVAGRGRAFLLGKAPDELAYMKRLVAARQGLRDWSIGDLPPLDLDDDGHAETAPPVAADETAQQIAGMRDRLAKVSETATQTAPPPTGKGPLPTVPGVPQKVVAVLYPLLASGRISAAEAGMALGVSKTVAYEHLAAMRAYGYAEVTGGGRSSGWQLPERPEVPEDRRAEVDRYNAARETISRYDTLEDLAQAAHDGLVDVDDDAREVLEEVRRIAGRKRLSVVPAPPGDDGE
jgi:hypothetical protein